jgi:very-short-patch-repair endonuclease
VPVLWTDTARMQAGLISRRQLLANGLTAGRIQRLLATDRLELLAPGIYRVSGTPVIGESAAWLAVLRTRSPFSYVSAAAWWGMPVASDGWLHITRLDRRRLDWPPGVRVHRVGLAREQVTVRNGLSVTTRVETVLDCMGWLRLGAARALADRAVQQGWISADDVSQRLQTQPGRWGNRQLRRLVPALGDGAAAESERRLHQLLRSHGVRGWVPNLAVKIGGYSFEVDVALPERKIAIEIDGYAYHSSDDRFQRDRTKQNALLQAGWRVLRFTWADLDERPSYVLAQITALLAA